VCEQAHQQLKEELGLDHFEGRSWTGLHRHTLMTMIAYAFLQARRLERASREKKKRRPPAATHSPRNPSGNRRRIRPTATLHMPLLPHNAQHP
jgi:SRSO17 transposase